MTINSQVFPNPITYLRNIPHHQITYNIAVTPWLPRWASCRATSQCARTAIKLDCSREFRDSQNEVQWLSSAFFIEWRWSTANSRTQLQIVLFQVQCFLNIYTFIINSENSNLCLDCPLKNNYASWGIINPSVSFWWSIGTRCDSEILYCFTGSERGLRWEMRKWKCTCFQVCSHKENRGESKKLFQIVSL